MEQQMQTEEWLLRLKSAYEAGYYRTEVEAEQQTQFPWQGKRCSDCPFWSDGFCRVHVERRAGMAHTCTYYDTPNHDAARTVIVERIAELARTWGAR